MQRFVSVRSMRRQVWALLMVWLFAFGAGWANACILQVHQVHHFSAAASVADQAAWSPDAAHHASLEQGICLNVCNDLSHGVLPGGAQADLSDLAPVSARQPDWAASLAPTAGFARDSDGPLRTTVPLRTRYMRLAL